MTIWFTADHHFGHANIIKYCNRPFENVDDMEAGLISRWNEKVKPNDEVYHLGDFTLNGHKEFRDTLSKLNGIVFFVPGGHDSGWMKKTTYMNVLPPLVTKVFDNVRITMCHYPMLSWEQSHYGAHHLHGHSHGTMGTLGSSSDSLMPPNQIKGSRLDVGVDCHNYYPISLEEALVLLNTLSTVPAPDIWSTQ